MYSLGTPPSVFISHSKHDEQNIAFFAKILANIGLKGHFMEWEKLGTEYAGSRISDIIRSDVQENTDAVFVLLGKSLENPPIENRQYTHNWVNFEVGVASGCKKPVWVFENIQDFIKFPIPYVTDYCLYRLNDHEHIKIIGDFLKQKILLSSYVKPYHMIKCPYQNCNASYNLWNLGLQNINCPVCRQPIKLG